MLYREIIFLSHLAQEVLPFIPFCYRKEATMVKCACVVDNNPKLTLYKHTSSSSSLILALIMAYFVQTKRRLACQKQLFLF